MASIGAIEEAVVAKLRALPPEKQQEVLTFAESLIEKSASHSPFPSLRGVLKDLGINVSAGEIDQARKEAWRNFPRENPFK